jgi:hypothetical protein
MNVYKGVGFMHKAFIFFKLLLGTIVGFFTRFSFDIHQIDVEKSSQEIVKKLQRFETSFAYPFSSDEEFTIVHGNNGDYFSFFKSLGKPYYYVALAKENKKVIKIIVNKEVTIEQRAGEIAGASCAVLRTLKDKKGKSITAWYLCDLKVNPNYQGEHLPVTMVKKIALPRFIQCARGFAICMNPANGDPKAASIFKKHGPIQGLQVQTLNLYSLSAEKAKENHAYLKSCLVKHGYIKMYEKLGLVTTSGNKDYVIRSISTGNTRPWNLLHLKPSLTDAQFQEGETYMICAVEGTLLDNDFKKKLGVPSSTAQIISYGMEDVDFNFLTSDQI